MSKRTAYITIRTDEETKHYLEELAQKDDRTLSYIINKIITDYLKRADAE